MINLALVNSEPRPNQRITIFSRTSAKLTTRGSRQTITPLRKCPSSANSISFKAPNTARLSKTNIQTSCSLVVSLRILRCWKRVRINNFLLTTILFTLRIPNRRLAARWTRSRINSNSNKLYIIWIELRTMLWCKATSSSSSSSRRLDSKIGRTLLMRTTDPTSLTSITQTNTSPLKHLSWWTNNNSRGRTLLHNRSSKSWQPSTPIGTQTPTNICPHSTAEATPHTAMSALTRYSPTTPTTGLGSKTRWAGLVISKIWI